MGSFPAMRQRILNADGTLAEQPRRETGIARRAAVAEPRSLLADAAAWLDALPAEVRPNRLARDFPRIVNRLSVLWSEPSRCEAYFDQLILDDRGGRAGFAPAVMKELTALAAHLLALRADRHSPWLAVRKR